MYITILSYWSGKVFIYLYLYHIYLYVYIHIIYNSYKRPAGGYMCEMVDGEVLHAINLNTTKGIIKQSWIYLHTHQGGFLFAHHVVCQKRLHFLSESDQGMRRTDLNMKLFRRLLSDFRQSEKAHDQVIGIQEWLIWTVLVTVI